MKAKTRKKRKHEHQHKPVGGADGVSIDICMQCGEMLIGLFDEDNKIFARTVIQKDVVAYVISELTLKYHQFAKRGAKPVEIGDPLILN